MKKIESKFSDFEEQKITKTQQKAVRGGDGDDSDPKKAGGGGGNG
ncbi:rSAM-modified peptide [Flavobacterium foetidum]|nr:rSAM-modified peptide [Flavobacterium foetidum]KAF2516094.1 rSAM-modified peptide [Flavobacterium foetidum]